MSDHPVRRVSHYVRSHPWAIDETKLDAMIELLDMRARGITLTAEEVQGRIGAASQRRETLVVNAVAIIPLCGVIAQKMNAFTSISGGTSTECFMAQMRQAYADVSVKGIVVDCDTPGGTIEGVIEAADELWKLRSQGTKPIVAVVNPWCASAGYWLASQCSEVVCIPSGQVGSIGVYMVHDDVSAANAQMGYKPTYIYFGDFKVETNPDQPLPDDAKAYLQQQVDRRGVQFVKAVARGRGVSVADVKANFGKGRMLQAEDALAVTMIDKVATLDDTITRLMNQASGGRRLAASAEPIPVTGIIDPRAQDEAPVAPIDGECPDGYELYEDDGMCYLVGQTPKPAAAALDAAVLAIRTGEDVNIDRDRDALTLALAVTELAGTPS